MTEEQRLWTPRQREIVKAQFARGASEEDLDYLELVCQRTQLDPFSGQIRFTPRRTKEDDRWITTWGFITTIDGLRSVAERGGRYAGQDAPIFEDKDGKPYTCSVAVYRKDFTRPVVALAFFEEYVQVDKEGQPTRMWRKMPRLMFAKCTEALALRKAFPAELARIYTEDEMGQAENPSPDPGPMSQRMAHSAVEGLIEPILRGLETSTPEFFREEFLGRDAAAHAAHAPLAAPLANSEATDGRSWENTESQEPPTEFDSAGARRRVVEKRAARLSGEEAIPQDSQEAEALAAGYASGRRAASVEPSKVVVKDNKMSREDAIEQYGVLQRYATELGLPVDHNLVEAWRKPPFTITRLEGLRKALVMQAPQKPPMQGSLNEPKPEEEGDGGD